MALITCPECEKDISSKVTACPHCGYPLTENNEPQSTPQPVEITGVNIASDPKKKKKLIIITASVVASIAVLLIAFFAIKGWQAASAREAYISDLVDARMTMLSGAAEAENICNLTQEVWSNTIYEKHSTTTDKYTISSGNRINSDFNTSLRVLYADEDTLNSIAIIEDNQDEVAEIIKRLQNPPESLQSCYETLDDMYETFQSLTSLAISPQGNLKTYSDNFTTYDTEFMKYYQKLEALIPEK